MQTAIEFRVDTIPPCRCWYGDDVELDLWYLLQILIVFPSLRSAGYLFHRFSKITAVVDGGGFLLLQVGLFNARLICFFCFTVLLHFAGIKLQLIFDWIWSCLNLLIYLLHLEVFFKSIIPHTSFHFYVGFLLLCVSQWLSPSWSKES